MGRSRRRSKSWPARRSQPGSRRSIERSKSGGIDKAKNPKKNPMNFNLSKKWTITMTTGLMTFVITFASSIFSTTTVETARLFKVSTEVTTLGTSLFVIVSTLSSDFLDLMLTIVGFCPRASRVGTLL